jgi:hypothetical protein
MNQPPAIRPFDFFRVQHAKQCVDVSTSTLRLWSTRLNGPKLYAMKEDKATWARYSEVEAFIVANSETKKAA